MRIKDRCAQCSTKITYSRRCKMYYSEVISGKIYCFNCADRYYNQMERENNLIFQKIESNLYTKKKHK